MTTLVTGAAGFVGRHVVQTLNRAGRTGRGHVRAAGDLAQTATWTAALDDVSELVHVAGVLPRRGGAPWPNRALAEALVESPRAQALRKVVYLSSVSVYGTDEVPGWGPFASAPTPGPYGADKAAAEQVLRQAFGARLAVLRPSSIAGPAPTLRSVLPTFVAAAKAGDPLRVVGPRAYVQNFIAVEDVADLAARLLDEDRDVVNAFSDTTLDMRALADAVKAALQSSSDVVDDRTGDGGKRASYDAGPARELLARPFTPLSDTILAMAEGA